MRERDVPEAVARLIWEERRRLAEPGMARIVSERDVHGDDEHEVALDLAVGIVAGIDPERHRASVGIDGQHLDLRGWRATAPIRAWRRVQCWRMLSTLAGAPDAPAPGALERIARAVLGAPGATPEEDALDRAVADAVRGGSTTTRTATVEEARSSGVAQRRIAWHDLPSGVSVAVATRHALDGSRQRLVAAHPDHGNVEIDGRAARREIAAARDRLYGRRLAPAAAAPPPALPQAGNARVDRVARLCRDAVTLHPDLHDGGGAAIRPLVERHLPDLIRRHADAVAVAPAERLDDLDADLEAGVEIVRRATAEALDLVADARHADLKVQLGFLRLRHPDHGKEGSGA